NVRCQILITSLHVYPHQFTSYLFHIMLVYHTLSLSFFFFFFNDTATTEIYTLSLHDALPIFLRPAGTRNREPVHARGRSASGGEDRKSTRLNSSHRTISYAVFCLKKKKQKR